MVEKQFSNRSKITTFLILVCLPCFVISCVGNGDNLTTSNLSTTSSPSLITITDTDTLSLTEFPISASPTVPTLTFTSEEVQNRVEDLLETNGNCDFPCWWGMMPGETNFNKAVRFLEGISESNGTWFSGEGIPVFSGSISVPEPVSLDGKLYFDAIGGGRIRETLQAQAVFGYALPMTDVLEMLGEPSEIQFSTPLWFPTTNINYDLFLFYPADGILVRFISETTTPDPENIIRICDFDTKYDPLYFGAGFLFFNTQDKLIFEEAIQLLYVGVFPPPLAPIEKISNMDTHSFYINFSQEESECLEINTQLFGFHTDPG